MPSANNATTPRFSSVGESFVFVSPFYCSSRPTSLSDFLFHVLQFSPRARLAANTSRPESLLGRFGAPHFGRGRWLASLRMRHNTASSFIVAPRSGVATASPATVTAPGAQRSCGIPQARPQLYHSMARPFLRATMATGQNSNHSKSPNHALQACG